MPSVGPAKCYNERIFKPQKNLYILCYILWWCFKKIYFIHIVVSNQMVIKTACCQLQFSRTNFVTWVGIVCDHTQNYKKRWLGENRNVSYESRTVLSVENSKEFHPEMCYTNSTYLVHLQVVLLQSRLKIFSLSLTKATTSNETSSKLKF